MVLCYAVFFILFFSPVLFGDKLLAPNDGLVHGIPNYYTSPTLWTNLLYSGFPISADPQAQTWYPLALALSWIPGSWNAYMVAVYVLSACFTFGYVYHLTRSRLAAMVAGFAYSMSGFMIGHLGQTPVVHGALWLPLILWMAERLRHKSSIYAMGLGGLAVTCCFLGGHPQIFAYAMMVVTAYVFYLGWDLGSDRWRYYGRYVCMVSLGLGLSALQLLPTAELAYLSSRSALDYEDFVLLSFPPKEILTLLFPYLFGAELNFYSQTYFGQLNFVEAAVYPGLLVLMLALIGACTQPLNRAARFWWVAIIVLFVFAMGEFTPWGPLSFHIPLYNKLRAPVRHFMEISLALSVLAGLGTAYIQKTNFDKTRILKTVLVGTMIFLGAWGALNFMALDIQKAALEKGVAGLSFNPWTNPAIGVPVLIFTLSAIAIIFWSRRPRSGLRQAFLVIVLVADLGSFSWFHDWNGVDFKTRWLTPPEATPRYQKLLEENNQRLIPVTGRDGASTQFPPNLSRLWKIPSATGYGPLALSRIEQMLFLKPPFGAIHWDWASPFNQSLDILAVRYALLPQKRTNVLINKAKWDWTQENLKILMGSGCGIGNANTMEILLPRTFQPTHVGIVSRLLCSPQIRDEQELVRISYPELQGSASTASLLAGRDTSAWTYDCESASPPVQHRKAVVFEHFDSNEPAGSPCQKHNYFSTLPLPTASPVKKITFNWTGAEGVIVLTKSPFPIDAPGKPCRFVIWRIRTDGPPLRKSEPLPFLKIGGPCPAPGWSEKSLALLRNISCE